MSQWLITNLSPEQLDRLDQIDLQWEGPAAMLTRPFYDESLSLTREQREKLTSCLTEGEERIEPRGHGRTRITTSSPARRSPFFRNSSATFGFGSSANLAYSRSAFNAATPAARVSSVPTAKAALSLCALVSGRLVARRLSRDRIMLRGLRGQGRVGCRSLCLGQAKPEIAMGRPFHDRLRPDELDCRVESFGQSVVALTG